MTRRPGTLHPRTLALVVGGLLALAVALGWDPPRAVVIWAGATVAVSVTFAWFWNRPLPSQKKPTHQGDDHG